MNVKAAMAVLLASAAGTAVVRADGAFDTSDQALWIDRFNYFRMTGLPWSASNMRRMDWNASLATSAASTAATCAATTAAGVNVFSASASSTNSSSLSLVDQAVNDWIVTTSLSTLATLDAPGNSGDGVGTGVYNSYSQAVWAATYSVGCASATCSDQIVVVCQFSPAGNDGASAWYIHADQGSQCPSGTTSSAGLCIMEGDAANGAIAPIPAGQKAYEVFPSYVADMQTVLIEAARSVASGTTAPPATTTAAPATTTATPSATTKTPSATTKTPSTASSSSTASTSGTSTTSGLSADSPTTATFDDDDGSLSPGTVKASSASGSTFENEVSSSSSATTTTTTTITSTASSSSAAATGSSTATTAESTTTASTTTTTTSSSSAGTSASGSTAVSANNKSSDSSSGVSATGMAGAIVVAVAAVAGVAVFVSYRKNQQRQRDIMQNGGIHVL